MNHDYNNAPDTTPETPRTDRLEGQTDRRQLLKWLWRVPVLVAAGATGFGVWEAYRVHFSKVPPDPTPTFTPYSSVRVGALTDFGEVWDTAEFTVAGTAAIALRLPDAIPGGISAKGAHYAAFSRVCTHLGCLVSLNQNLEALAVAFNYRSAHPAFACPCHLSAFSPLEAGRAVSGPARQPLPRAQLQIRGDALFAVGLELPS